MTFAKIVVPNEFTFTSVKVGTLAYLLADKIQPTPPLERARARERNSYKRSDDQLKGKFCLSQERCTRGP